MQAKLSLTAVQNLYRLSELTQVMIKHRAEAHHWPIAVYPGKIRLPRDVFHNLEGGNAGLENSRKSYLPVEIIEWGALLGKKSVAGPSVSYGAWV